MTILSIETSCDDTCVAILKIKNKKSKIKNFEILSNIVSSQVEIHKKYGGVYPFLAKREHQRNLLPVLIKALKQSKLLKISNFQFPISKQIPNSKFQIPKPKVDAIAVTIGPGLEPCLWTGVNLAKKLARDWNLPIVPVNHIEAHIFANLLSQISLKSKIKNQKSKIDIKNKKIEFSAICLVVSGGHTQLILMRDFGKYKILGETRDDAAGECFDKVARILGLGYPGGPAIAKEAIRDPLSVSDRERVSVKLPRPMINQKNYDFSFSGLKTAALYKVRSMKYEETKKKKFIQEMCKETQQAIIDVLIKKTIKAAKDFRAKTIILGGGVAANDELRKQFAEKIKKELPNIQYLIPNIQFCTDNAVMTAIAGYFHQKEKTKNWKKIKADANIRI